jgi:cytoskeletal protein CcmA (bactofilin family)
MEAFMAESGQDFPTILGADARLKGEISFEKGMRVHGHVEGKVTSGGRLHIAKEAHVMADVSAAAIVVEGEVKGNMTAADRIDLKASARYEGDLRAARLVVEEGAVFSGHVSVGPDAMKGGAGVSMGGGRRESNTPIPPPVPVGGGRER